MADNARRKGPGPTAATTRANYLPLGGQPSPYAQQQQQSYGYQQNPYKQAQQAQQQGRSGFSAGAQAQSRYGRDSKAPVRAQKPAPASSKMGIKSGMTVEDLKRLTQKRMQQSAAAATTPTAAAQAAPASQVANVVQESLHARPATPTHHAQNPAAAPSPIIPKTGMSVQELKQLTTLRLASQNVPLHQSEITGLVSKTVLANAAKSHYRDSLRSSLTSATVPKRMSGANPGRSNQLASPAHSAVEVRGHRSRSRSSTYAKTVDATADTTPSRYSYSGQSMEEFLNFDGGRSANNSSSSQETDTYTRPSLDLDLYDEPRNSLQFPDDSFPPPPPVDESGAFVSTSLPSWSPPPSRIKKLDTTPVSFYNQQTSYYNIASKEENTTQDQNAVIAPPPGFSRRPSMTVPWQVAEAVLNTPQTVSNRKQLVSPSPASKKTLEPETYNMFAQKPAARAASSEGNNTSSGGLKSPAAEAAAQLGAPRGRKSSLSNITAPPPAPAVAVGAQGLNAAARRGSFGNAAEFFKFRRRSKSRLELARDVAGNFVNNDFVFPNYGTSGTMPGIDERRDEAQDTLSVLAQADETISDASSSSSDDGESSSQDYDDDELVRITGGYEDPSELSGNFVSFYHSTGGGRGGRELSGLSALSIPPPPPPPMTDEDDDASTTSSKGLPMMSPNGVRLRKVAELARRGSLSNEDKTRAKDEIIQSSLGIGASNAARIFSSKMGERSMSTGDRPPVSPPMFAQSVAPPRNTPKASLTKSLTPGVGIVRSSSSTGLAALSPSKQVQASPTSSSGSRKTLGNDSADGSNNSNAAVGTLEERLAAAAQRMADCVGKGDMVGFQQAMSELDWLRNEANSLMRG